MTRTKTIEDWLAEAWAQRDECPPPELFLPSEWDELEEATRARALQHLETCPACSAERDLAAAFEAPPLANPRSATEVEAILGQLATGSEGGSAAASGRLLRFPPLAKLVPQRAMALAAAALVVVAAALVVRSRVAAPGLPDVPTTDIVRSGRVLLTAPVGEVETLPASLDWLAVEGAATYRVTLTAVDETVLWSDEASGPPLALPAAVRSGLRARVVYFWQVEAFDGKGARLAWSRPTEFRSLTEAPPAGETPR